jgi:hypothetical protein
MFMMPHITRCELAPKIHLDVISAYNKMHACFWKELTFHSIWILGFRVLSFTIII